MDENADDYYEHYRIQVDKGQSPLRLDRFLMNRLENASRNRIAVAIGAGNVLVGGLSVKASYKAKPFDVITIVLPHPPRDTEIIPEDIPLDIRYEDEDIILVNKPAGMVVHPGYANFTGTLVNALAWHLKHQTSTSDGLTRAGLVHRIDKDTSGLLLVSKNETAMTYLARQFFDHSIERDYQALVWGDPPQSGQISGYIGRSARDRRVMELYDDPSKGKWSVTHFTTVERFGLAALVTCTLETGKTHQIRCHMRSLGFPLFADPVYGGKAVVRGPNSGSYKKFIEHLLALMPGQALHARTLGFIHPRSHENFVLEVDLPDYFRLLLDKWRTYSTGS